MDVDLAPSRAVGREDSNTWMHGPWKKRSLERAVVCFLFFY